MILFHSKESIAGKLPKALPGKGRATRSKTGCPGGNTGRHYPPLPAVIAAKRRIKSKWYAGFSAKAGLKRPTSKELP